MYQEYLDLGYINYDEIPELLGVSHEKIQKSGLFKKKEMKTSACIYSFDLSEKGEVYFKHIRGGQIFILKSEMIRAFLIEMQD